MQTFKGNPDNIQRDFNLLQNDHSKNDRKEEYATGYDEDTYS